MDNASKALIMAGAILIAIAIVGVGVFIFSSTSSITNTGDDQLNASAVQLTNSQLRKYAGTRVRGTTVIEMIEYINTLNTSKVLPIDMSVDISGISGDVTTADITENAYYTVQFSDTEPAGSLDGYYDTCTIEANKQ